MAGLNKLMPMVRSRKVIIVAAVMPGVARTCKNEVARIVQPNIGSCRQPMPGVRRLTMVTMKLMPAKMDEKPTS